jgi:hypothetical protein
MPTHRTRLRIALVVAASLLSAGSVQAEQMSAVISTGQASGSYFAIGHRLRTAMKLEHDLDIQVETSFGSLQNLARLADPSSDVSIALTQADALSRFLHDNAGFASQFLVLGDMGRECALLITDRKSSVVGFSDLKNAPGSEVSVNDLGSGAAVTFEYLKVMNPGLRNLKLRFVDTMEALLQMRVAGPASTLKATMLVQRPSTRTEVVKVLLQNAKDYRLIPIRASDVENGRLPDGSVVYSFEKVNVGESMGPDTLEVETLCTRGLLLASKKKLGRDFRSKLAASMLGSSDKVSGKRK